MGIIHKYKGYEIVKHEHRYCCATSWTEIWYKIKGVDKHFEKLREAKQYIDKIELRKMIYGD